MGGIYHALFHGLGTFLVLLLVTDFATALALALVDFILHYHIDWAKMKFNKLKGWGPMTHEQFWTLLGLDQYLHALTYIGIVLVLVIK